MDFSLLASKIPFASASFSSSPITRTLEKDCVSTHWQDQERKFTSEIREAIDVSNLNRFAKLDNSRKRGRAARAV